MPLVFLLYALFASVFVIAKIALDVTQPLFLVGSRMVIAGLLMIGYQWWFARPSLKVQKGHISTIFQLALFNIYLTNAFEFWGLQHLTSFKTCFIYSLSPFLAALLSYLMFSEKMTARKWVGMGIGFAGFLPILLAQDGAERELGHLFFLSQAEIWVILAAACSVYGWSLLRKMVKDFGYPSITANGITMLLGGVMALFHSYLAEPWTPLPVSNLFTFTECVILLIVISNFACYNLYGYLLRKFTSTFLSFAGWTTPVFAALFGWIMLGEVVTWHFYLSAFIVLAGMIVFYQAELRQGYYLTPNESPT